MACFDKLFLMTDVINSGRYGSVYRATRVSDGVRVAVKKLPISRHDIDPIVNYDMLRRENANWSKVTGHHNVLELLGRFEDKENVYFVSELCESGSLAQMQQSLSLAEVKTVVRHIVRGVRHCHSLHVAHCDVKPANVLLSEDTWKLADFGNSQVNDSEKDGLYVKRGTPSYAAPELFNGYYGNNIDMWAIGILAFQYFCNGLHPFYNGTDNKEFVRSIQNDDIQWPSNIPLDLKDFVNKCLSRDASKRLSSYEALTHPLLK
jgi:serine/threonine protein kinase